MTETANRPYRPDLETHLPALLELDEIRTQAMQLRDIGLRVLLDLEGDPLQQDARALGRPGWEPCDDTLERILLRRAKHLAWSVGLLPEGSTNHRIEELPDLRLEELLGSKEQPMSVFLAATYLRTALDEPGQYIPRSVFYCYYRLVRELYFLDSPDWNVGGARAGTASTGAAPVSAFMTCEVARALGVLRNKLSRTADFIVKVGEILDYQESRVESLRMSRVGSVSSSDSSALGLDDRWCDVELERVLLSLRITLSEAKGAILFDVQPPPRATQSLGHSGLESPDQTTLRTGGPKGDQRGTPSKLDENPGLPTEAGTRDLQSEFTAMRNWFGSALAMFVNKTAEEINAAVKHIDEFRKLERQSFDESQALADDYDDVMAENRLYALSTTAHQKALHALDAIKRPVSAFLKELAGGDFCSLRSISRLVEWLCLGDWGLQATLKPTANYTASVLNQALAEHSAGRPVIDTPEVIFAAACAGSITGRWNDPMFAKAVVVLSQAVDEHGNIPGGRPFHLGPKGSQYNAANAHAIRAFAQILEHVPMDLEPLLIKRFYRFFSDGVVPFGSTRVAWGRGLATYRPFACGWTTATSVLALHRIVRMLDAKINAQVKKYFVVRGPRQLDNVPTISGLMCTDVGLTALSRMHGRPRQMTTFYLELMRAHLAGPRAVAASEHDDVWSVVLYGPPGTGKTTLFESLARTRGTDLVYLSPSDFLVSGIEGIERRATAVMTALTLLTETVILFDEFDSVLHSRGSYDGRPVGVLDFLPGSMLPKFAALNAAAQKRRCVYGLATNYIHRVDEAAIRPGRFNHRIGVLPPDVPSRICRLTSEVQLWLRRRAGGKAPVVDSALLAKRIQDIVRDSAGIPTVVLCKRGWFTAPKEWSIRDLRTGRAATPWDYMFAAPGTSARVSWPMPEACAEGAGGDAGDLATQIAVDQASELSLLRDWNALVFDYTAGAVIASWAEWLKFLWFGSDKAALHFKNVERRLEELRFSRLGLRSGPVLDPKAAENAVASAMKDEQRQHGGPARKKTTRARETGGRHTKR